MAALSPAHGGLQLSARERLASLMQDSYDLGGRATRLHRADRLSQTVNREVWFKRDDLTAFALGGNKVRKLETIAAAALSAEANHLVTVGAAQSNHVRVVAAAASTLGMRCDLVIGAPQPPRLTGNARLCALFGARLHYVGSPDWRALGRESARLTLELKDSGSRPYLIPVGGATPEGSLAFAAAYIELSDQCRRAGVLPSAVVHASSSGGTQAGLELGRWLTNDDMRVVGVDVAAIDDHLDRRVADLARESAQLLGIPDLDISPTVLSGYLGAGYAEPSHGAQEAQRLVARCEGVLLDHVYTAKAMHALIEQREDSPVVFWHTGGSPAFFSQEAPDV